MIVCKLDHLSVVGKMFSIRKQSSLQVKVSHLPRGLYYKTLYGRNLLISVKSKLFTLSLILFVPGKPLQPSLMFVGKARGPTLE
jgi:hypothetical protein